MQPEIIISSTINKSYNFFLTCRFFHRYLRPHTHVTWEWKLDWEKGTGVRVGGRRMIEDVVIVKVCDRIE